MLFSTYASTGHLFPLVPLAWQFRAAGHEVQVAAPPAFVGRVRATGLPGRAVGRDTDPGAAWQGFDFAADGSHAAAREDRTRRTMTMFRSAAEAVVDELLDVASRGTDLIVFDPREYAAAVAAARLGIPSARLLYGVDHTYAQRGAEWPLLAPLWERFGAGRPDPSGSVTLDPCPSSLQLVRAPGHRPMRHIPFNGPHLVPPGRFDDIRRPSVLVTWGTSLGQAQGHLAPVVELARQTRRVAATVVLAVAAEQRAALSGVPHDVRVVESVPLQQLLPHCDAIVHQGGAGTTMTAAALGVPQLVVPVKGDQLVHAERIAARGVGLALPWSGLGPGDVGDALSALLEDPRYRRAAREVAAECAGRPSLSTTVAALEELAHGRR